MSEKPLFCRRFNATKGSEPNGVGSTNSALTITDLAVGDQAMAACHSHNDSARSVNAKSRVELCAERLRSLAEYDPDTGDITYLPRTEDDFLGSKSPEKSARYFNKTFAGRRAMTTKNASGYYCGSVGGVRTMAHRVAWVLYYGSEPDVIDHINGDRTDNRICNLRSVTVTGNARNSGVRANSPSMITGVVDAKPKAWGARWRVVRAEGGRVLGTKMFHCLGDAIRFRNQDLRERGFAPMHGIRPSAGNDNWQSLGSLAARLVEKAKREREK